MSVTVYKINSRGERVYLADDDNRVIVFQEASVAFMYLQENDSVLGAMNPAFPSKVLVGQGIGVEDCTGTPSGPFVHYAHMDTMVEFIKREVGDLDTDDIRTILAEFFCVHTANIAGDIYSVSAPAESVYVDPTDEDRDFIPLVTYVSMRVVVVVINPNTYSKELKTLDQQCTMEWAEYVIRVPANSVVSAQDDTVREALRDQYNLRDKLFVPMAIERIEDFTFTMGTAQFLRMPVKPKQELYHDEK